MMNKRFGDGLVEPPHTHSWQHVLERLGSARHGLTRGEAQARLAHHGPNLLPKPKLPSPVALFLRQFASPLIVVLLAAAVRSLLTGHGSDTLFIGLVLLVNALIGTIQEVSAQRAAAALDKLMTTRARVVREGESWEIDAAELVPGDIVLLESGDRVAADLRLIGANDLELDESLLTGESLPVAKSVEEGVPADTPMSERCNMAFAGTLVARGQGRGLVVATGAETELGDIAANLSTGQAGKAPLVMRMEKFARGIAVVVAVAAVVVAIVALQRDMALSEVFMLAVALAVSAIPEGLPVALTVALAIGMRRMARRNVIIRRLVAVEALGSCTYIATDKTGTLTVNQLTVQRIQFPPQPAWEVTGEGIVPEGQIIAPAGTPKVEEKAQLERLCRAAVLANDAFLGRRDGEWVAHGDAVEVALLVMAHKGGITHEESLATYPRVAEIPFESERLYSAAFHELEGRVVALVKGAVERLLPMCSHWSTPEGDQPLTPEVVEAQARELAANGYRVLAIAEGTAVTGAEGSFDESTLRGLTFLGLVGMIDPLRSEAKGAVAACRQAGILVAMVTGDHPLTALAIGRQLGLGNEESAVVTGPQLKAAEDPRDFDRLTARARIFARVEPRQKLDIVSSLQRQGHFVAVSGDGANDAPALRAAQVGVAMGRSGTEVARESADLIITDDNFASIVAGVEEGRIAYANVRKVIFLLISTGAAELVLFTLALFTGQPLPLMAVQLLWLNLVTNGIQDVALAFEPGEGHELRRPPRSPDESIFNRLMIERVVVSALVMGGVAFMLFQTLLARGFTLDEARNGTLLLMVLFENIHVFNSRSEIRSVFRHSLLRNPFLLFGTLAAQLLHIGAMYTPWLSDVLRVQPVSARHWLELLGTALSILVVMELHKALRTWWVNRD